MSEPVVTLHEMEPGIVRMTMADRVNKNTFSDELIAGLSAGFKAVDAEPECKVVILTGYDSYFACGGTQDSLLAIHGGGTAFSDVNVYSLALECKVPVIAAMQGHAIGGGFAFGLFSDFVIFSRESIYTTNFMRYGFTPGMGATFIVSRKLGIALAEELLLTARNYRGAELKARGIPFPVLPRAEVMPHALSIARSIAEKPRLSLITLKDHLVAGLRARLPAVIEQEVVMHDKTFHQEEVKERIIALFGK